MRTNDAGTEAGKDLNENSHMQADKKGGRNRVKHTGEGRLIRDRWYWSIRKGKAGKGTKMESDTDDYTREKKLHNKTSHD